MADGLFLGTDLEGRQRLFLDPDHLTTHAVCLGMTGSGKTGLGIVALEELARRKVPLLVIDLKGDMVNLLLTFPSLTAEAFRPWLSADEVAGRDPMEVAAEQAELWRGGLEREDLASADLEAVRAGVAWQLITPGLASLAPLDILPALSAPAGWDADADPDSARQRVDGLASALLSLIGRGGDALTDRDHVLLASVILEHWRQGDSLDLVGLLGSLIEPPISRLGAFPLDTFYPRDDRLKLAMELNTLVASPAFAAWTRGVPLDMDVLLGTPAAPRASIVSIAHLDTRQRLFVLGLLFSELVAWMRRQPASGGLRALLYVDEVQGILPPHPAAPPTKGPLLTLLKQGRAFGVGAWLATQNPVDLDYKALGNAGLKLVGRLITDRDRDRALEGLGITRLEDGRQVDDLVAGLEKRHFVLHNVRAKERVRLFSSRWAMSYLRGPVTLAEMEPLLEALPSAAAAREPPVAAAAESPHSADSSASPPVLSSPVEHCFAAAGEGLAHPEVLLNFRLTLERKTLKLFRRTEHWWRVPLNTQGALDYDGAVALDGEPELVAEAPPAMSFPSASPAGLDEEIDGCERDFVVWRARNPVMVLVNSKLKCAAEPGESREDFVARCLELADRADDRQQERARERFERKMAAIKKRIARERDELDRDQVQLDSRRTEEKLGMVEGLFSVLLGSRSIRSATGKAATRVRSAASKRRIRQRAEASVVESEREIDRLEDDLDDLADELEEEIERIADESEERAEAVEEVPVRPRQADVQVVAMKLLWR